MKNDKELTIEYLINKYNMKLTGSRAFDVHTVISDYDYIFPRGFHQDLTDVLKIEPGISGLDFKHKDITEEYGFYFNFVGKIELYNLIPLWGEDYIAWEKATDLMSTFIKSDTWFRHKMETKKNRVSVFEAFRNLEVV